MNVLREDTDSESEATNSEERGAKSDGEGSASSVSSVSKGWSFVLYTVFAGLGFVTLSVGLGGLVHHLLATPEPVTKLTKSFEVVCENFEIIVQDMIHEDAPIVDDSSNTYGQCTTADGDIVLVLDSSTAEEIMPDDVPVTIRIRSLPSPSVAPNALGSQKMFSVDQIVSSPSPAPTKSSSLRKSPALTKSSSLPKGDHRRRVYKEMDILFVIMNYKDTKPWLTPEKIMSRTYGRRRCFAEAIKNASFGKLTAPESRGQAVAVNMGTNWASLTNDCTVDPERDKALKLVPQQYPGVDPDTFTYRSFYFPYTPRNGCNWGGTAGLGCGTYFAIPKPKACNLYFRHSGRQLQAHEFGHALGVNHAGAFIRRRQSSPRYNDYGDGEAAMGFGFSNLLPYTQAAREQMGFLQVAPGQILQWTPSRKWPIDLGSMELPLGQTNIDCVAIKFACPSCRSVYNKYKDRVGGYLWVQLHGDRSYAGSLEEKYRNKVFVHFARSYTHGRGSGTELWGNSLSATDTFEDPYSGYKVNVCEIGQNRARVAIGPCTESFEEACGTRRQACNPSSCATGLTCAASRSKCCAANDWECCGTGAAKFSSRLYCPLTGKYTVMCMSGICMQDEARCSKHGGVKIGSPPCHTACNPSSCATGLTCAASPNTCCAADDWECCGKGETKYGSRLYCPLTGRYLVMCMNGYCREDEARCSKYGGVKFANLSCATKKEDASFLPCGNGAFVK